MFRKKHYVALGLVTLATLLVLNLPAPAASRLKTGIGALFLPLFGLASNLQQLPGAVVDDLTPRSQLVQENNSLRQQNQELLIRQQQADTLLEENNQLRDQLGWQRQQKWKLKLANVVLRDPANWWKTVQIDAGTRDGVREGCPVLTSAGLVGKVSSVGLVRSQVVLLGDPNCRVSALVEDSQRDVGVLSASGPLDNSLAELTYLSGNANLKSGQVVVSSGMGGVFPAGIPIGQVMDSWPVDYGLYTQARVKLSANLGALTQVWVILQ
jgi:rod shape-determining protein MreC